MNFLDRFLKSKVAFGTTVETAKQAILIYIAGEDLEGSCAIQDELLSLLDNSELGMFDGNEVGGGELVLFLYGLDAEALFKFIEPTLRGSDFCKGARVVLRWGGPGSPKRELIL